MPEENEDYTPSFNKKGYTGRCHGCRDQVPVGELIKIKKSMCETHFYWLCEYCHVAYWHGGFSESAIWDDLNLHHKQRNNATLEEVIDPIRKSGKKLMLEDIADMVYDLNFKKTGEIWRLLEK